VRKAMGLDLAPISDETRRRFSLKAGLKGVVVTRVDPNSSAAEKRIQPGDVIVEVAQQAVSSPDEVARRIEVLKKEGKKAALLLVANAQGDVRFVAISVE
jgi:serine protease Do